MIIVVNSFSIIRQISGQKNKVFPCFPFLVVKDEEEKINRD